MDCSESRRLLHAYLDGELDVSTTALVEEHLRGCAGCRHRLEEQMVIRNAFDGIEWSEPVTRTLRRRITSAIDREAKERFRPAFPAWRWIGAAAALCVLAVVALLVLMRPGNGTQPLLAEELIQSHIRSLMVNHLTDVTSSDQHTVKPWFNGKIDFSPEVRDFAAEGYPLIGGRLDYVDGAPAAVLVYQRHSHVINLFITRKGSAQPVSRAIQGYNILSWESGGAVFHAVSDLNTGELDAFRKLIVGS